MARPRPQTTTERPADPAPAVWGGSGRSARRHRNISGTEYETGLIRRAQAGDVAARNLLVEHHLPFIRFMVGKACDASDTIDEFLSYGVEGFILALGRFDIDRGFRLTGYAGQGVWRTVRNAMLARSVIQVPRGSKTERTKEYETRAWSIQTLPAGYEGPACHDPDPVAREERCQLLSLIRKAVSNLDPRLQEVLLSRLAGITLANIGAHISLTKERVRQLESAAVDAVRADVCAALAGATA